MPPESSPDNTDKTDIEQTSTAVASQETPDVKDTSAESSPAENKGETGDILSAVKAALSPKEKPPVSESKGSESEDKPEVALTGAEQGADPDDLTEDELAKLRPKTRKRIENLLQDRQQRDGKIAELEPKAQRFEQLVRFVQEANLSTDEVNEGFEVMRLMKNDPLKAWERLKPIVASLQAVVGEVLPEDLQIAVNQGEITEPRARELARSRNQAALSNNRAEHLQRKEQEAQQRQSHEMQQTEVRNAVVAWEKSKAGSDPDWKLKQARVLEMVQLETLSREKANPNFVWTPDAAVEFANKALERVQEEFKRLAPRPKAINPVTDVASTRSEAKPRNAVEAAKLGLARMAG